jgi:hypothetical protein
MSSKTIELLEPIKGPGGKQISAITLREPKYRDYMELDLPVIYVRLENGGGFQQETPSAIRVWVERLADCDPNFMERLCLADTIALRDTVNDFFIEARTRSASTRSTGSPDTSSSSEDRTFEPSRI